MNTFIVSHALLLTQMLTAPSHQAIMFVSSDLKLGLAGESQTWHVFPLLSQVKWIFILLMVSFIINKHINVSIVCSMIFYQ